MAKLCCVWTSGVFGVVLLILGFLTAFLFDPLISYLIDKELVIQNGTEFYETWVEPPVVPYLNVYFFNVTNADDVVQGDKPAFQELGPYSYREHWKKVNITFHDNGTVSYETEKVYFFDPERSSGPETDIIHTLNIPLAVAADRVKGMGNLVQLILASAFEVLNVTTFIEKSVNDLVWGYSDPLLILGNKFLPPDKQIPFTEFGFFFQKNGSSDGLYSINTGSRGFGNYTLIDTFNRNRELSYWNTPECNMINGTDGTSYPPNISKQSVLYLFNENLCRSLPLVFNSTVRRYDIDGYRFTPPANVFADVSENPDNACFCIGGPPCIGGGVFNISVCKFDSPTLISWPHFYQADEKYLKAIKSGLRPDASKHALYIDVIPKMGSPLAAQARLQINFKTTRLAHVKILESIPEMVFPVIWFEDGVAALPDKVISLLQLSTNVPKDMKLSFLVVFFIVGGALTTASLVLFVLRLRAGSSKGTITSVRPVSSTSRYDSDREKGHTNPAVSPHNPDATSSSYSNSPYNPDC